MQTRWLSQHINVHLNKRSPLSPCQGLAARQRGGGIKSAFSEEGEHLIFLFLYSFLRKRGAGESDKNGSVCNEFNEFRSI